MYIANKYGDSTPPCRIPYVSWNVSENNKFHFTQVTHLPNQSSNSDSKLINQSDSYGQKLLKCLSHRFTVLPFIVQWFTADRTVCMYGLSHWCNGSHHLAWDLTCAVSPILERHILWQIWHWKLLVVGGPDFRRSRLASNSRIRRDFNSCTADLHVDRQSALSLTSVSRWDGVMPHWFSIAFRWSLWRLYCPPGRRGPWESVQSHSTHNRSFQRC